MQKQKKVDNRSRTLVIILVSVLFTITAVIFLSGVVRYWLVASNLSMIEKDAQQGYYTQYGRSYWSDFQTKEWNAAKERKNALINSNDVARWCYYSGYSNVGKALRAIVIVVMLVIMLFSGFIAYANIRYMVYKAMKRRKRRYQKMMMERKRNYCRNGRSAA